VIGVQDVTPRRDDSLTDPTAKVAPPWTYPSPMRADQTDDPCLRIDLSMVNAPCLAQWDVQVTHASPPTPCLCFFSISEVGDGKCMTQSRETLGLKVATFFFC